MIRQKLRLSVAVLSLLWLLSCSAELARATAVMTVAECITESGYTSDVYSEIAYQIAGVDAWTDDAPALAYGETVGVLRIATDTGDRRVLFIRYEGDEYVFVYRDRAEPGAVEITSYGEAWHGSCLLRVGA